MRNVGMVLGLAISGAVLYNVAPIATSTQLGALSNEEIRELLSGFSWAYISGAALALVVALTSLATARPDAQDEVIEPI